MALAAGECRSHGDAWPVTRAAPRSAVAAARFEDIPLEASVRVKTAARVLDADESHVRELLRHGELKGHRWGKRGVRIFVSSIDDYRRRQALGGKPAEPPKPPRPKPPAGHAEALAYLRDLDVL